MSDAKILSFGYRTADIHAFEALVKKNNWLVVDIRFSPYSANRRWDGGHLLTIFSSRNYVHVKDLGNRNYKIPRKILYVDLDRGIEQVKSYLKEGRTIVVLCVCADHDLCHRNTVCSRLSAETGAEIIRLYPEDLLSFELNEVSDPYPTEPYESFT